MIPRDDYTTAIIDGQEELLLSAKGLLGFIYTSWVADHMPRAKEALQRYCRYLSTHGYKGSAESIYRELLSHEDQVGIEWLRYTCMEYVLDETDMVKFIMCFPDTGGGT